MSAARVWRVMRKELRMGPRSPIVLWAIVLPVAMTFIIRGVFGSLFDPNPRLAIVDEGDSVVAVEAQALAGIEVTVVEDADQLRRAVELHDFDAGLVLQAGFDQAVRSGERPTLQLYIAGESLASNRIIIAVTAIDLVREVAGEPPPVDVEVVSFGEEGLDLATRLIPLIVMYAVAISGSFVPAASLVEERESRTLDALLVTPTTMPEVLAAKGAVGFLLAMATGLVTLFLNSAFTGEVVALLLALILAGVMMVEIGLILGCWAKDANTMFAAFKGGGILLFYPVIFYIWPTLPDWVARLGPTFYYLNPLFRVAAEGAALGDVWVDMAIGWAICAALLPLVAVMGRRMERELATV